MIGSAPLASTMPEIHSVKKLDKPAEPLGFSLGLSEAEREPH